ncbi:hypothetical protein C8Q76DRAFT_587754, partial [Earliella scabrosa]
MVGCKLLAKISEALVDAKGIDTAFGGLSIILAGDFAQLPPVSETRLYAWVRTGSNRAGTEHGQQVVMGKLLWLSFNTVVILDKVMRQHGPENHRFVDLLSRLREGRCTDEDFQLLQTRLLETQLESVQHAEDWSEAPIIVSDNASKDALNVCAAQSYAHRTGRPLHWYYARD